MKKLFLFLAAMCCMSMGLKAATSSLYVGSVYVTDENCNDVLGDGTVSYDMNTKVLTLNNATITNASGLGISALKSLTIEFSGTCRIQSTCATADQGHALFCAGSSLSISPIDNSDGNSLTVVSAHETALFGGGQVNVNDANLTFIAPEGHAMDMDGSLVVYGSTTLTAQGNNSVATIVNCTGLVLNDGLALTSNHTYDATNHRFIDNATNAEAKNEIVIRQPETYTVTVSAENGTVTGGGEYQDGSTVTLTATPNTGYKFSKWSDGTTDNPYTFTVTEDVDIEAYFVDATDLAQNIPYIDADGTPKICPQALIVQPSKTVTVWTSGWYVVNSDVDLKIPRCNGDVHLILMDGESMNLDHIEVQYESSLTIYGQTQQTGKMELELNSNTASAIGGSCSGGSYSGRGGSVTINGGDIKIDGTHRKAIGGGWDMDTDTYYSAKSLTINRGKVVAKGGFDVNDIRIATDLVIKAGTDASSATVIANDGSNLSSILKGKVYVTVGPADDTGIEDIHSSSATYSKVIRDGQLFILRDGKMYNAQGALVR